MRHRYESSEVLWRRREGRSNRSLIIGLAGLFIALAIIHAHTIARVLGELGRRIGDITGR